MAQTTTNIAIGLTTLGVGAWVTNQGATSTPDVGHTKSDIKLGASYSDADIESEQSYGSLRLIPTDAKVHIKIPMLETVGGNMQIALRQPAANLTAGPPLTLLVGALNEQYQRIVLTTKGVGAGPYTRTITAWRCSVASLDDVTYSKKEAQMFNVTFRVLYDDSFAGADHFFKIVDS